MRRILFVATVLVVLVAVCGSQALADRLILAPTGSVLGAGTIKAEAAFSSVDAAGALVGPSDAERVYWLNIGLGRFEIEGTRFEVPGGAEENTVGVEVSVLPETLVTPAVGVGVRDVGDEIERGYYLAVTKTVPLSDKIPMMPIHDIKVHAGYGIDGVNGLFAGAQVGLPMRLTLYLEGTDDAFNAALSWNVIPKIGLKIYSLDGEFFYGADFKLAL